MEGEKALIWVKNMEQMICVTAFPAAASLRCFNIASSPVTTNFTLTHPMARVLSSAVFQGNRNGIHPCRAMGGKKRRILSRKKQQIFFGEWAYLFPANSPTDLMPAGAICSRGGGLVGEWGINVSLSSDSDKRRFHSPPSSLCHIVNPVVPLASRGPAWIRAQSQIKAERHGKKKGSERYGCVVLKPQMLHMIWWDICRCWWEYKPPCGCFCVQIPSVMLLWASSHLLYLLLHW